ncbi:MAG: 30S ribosomal protein S6 [Phycisphaerales bacterium]|nr:30S ribosomal protein S6 [Phycisphaerales bacterium]
MSDRISVYEAMFLINQSEAADFNGAIAHIEEILHRGHAELVSMRKWDERRLAFEIDKQRRGVYILTYFRAPTKSIAHIERDCNLSERIMRVLILSAEHLTDEEIASQNDREGLKMEARLRAERAADAASRTPEPEPVDAE